MKPMSGTASKVAENTFNSIPVVMLRVVHELTRSVDAIGEFWTSDEYILKRAYH